jgi:putative transposase
MDVFFSDEDREEYLRLLLESGEAHGLEFLGYCLMSNHVHLLVVPRDEESLAAGVGRAHERYTRGINFREGWRGYLWQGRFFSCPLDEREAMAGVSAGGHRGGAVGADTPVREFGAADGERGVCGEGREEGQTDTETWEAGPEEGEQERKIKCVSPELLGIAL